ncbi:Helix-loop-helix DNA-binding domain protein [Opisthorchis viverrini]|uniref:Uncharacterized protein n=2 Tax=Opisthorchis viverrini TaxID=6198 RepID=A0A075AJA6_OPIVI|nr:hypothetical protein T265_00953 [Opisthorchis viverrini]KER33049.1 hypothetical protein T265_00953 [Opisthorchis viverrini]OON21790.1 Helix-loop-helix DNA-binding domain protein [Opisthorchis viverrini]
MSDSLLVTSGGKRRGRKPGLNSTVAQRSAANARERSRMRVLSGAFVELKGALPWVPKDTKLSKLDTLKLAAGYIAYLRRILDTASDSDDSPQEDGLTCSNSPEKSLSLFSLTTHTGQSLKSCLETSRLQHFRTAHDRSVSESEFYPGRATCELGSSLCQEIRPFLGIPSDCIYSEDIFSNENKASRNKEVVPESKFGSTPPQDHCLSTVHSKNSWQNYHCSNKGETCDLTRWLSIHSAEQDGRFDFDNKTFNISASESPDYLGDRPEHAVSHFHPLMREHITSSYGSEAAVLNTELSRLLSPTIKTLWSTNRLDDMCPDVSHLSQMKYTTDFLNSSQSVYPIGDINADRLFTAVGAKYPEAYFTKV